ncbi:MAG: hypothetical protein QOF10_4139 [Kribbellaceae bacterium]|jgi:hypothetical protein|nr:hypothetical protein [Kribbellaceae bacterium]
MPHATGRQRLAESNKMLEAPMSLGESSAQCAERVSVGQGVGARDGIRTPDLVRTFP